MRKILHVVTEVAEELHTAMNQPETVLVLVLVALVMAIGRHR